MRKRRLIREAWRCRDIYRMTQLHPVIHFLYMLKYMICVLLGWYRKDAGGELIWMSSLYPVYNSYCNPPDPAWDEHFVGKGLLRNWYFSEETGLC